MIARNWGHLDPVRSLCELEGIPVQMANEEFTGVWHLRETRALVDWLRGRDSGLVSNADLEEWLAGQAPNPWTEMLGEAVAEYALETGDSETPVESFVEWLAEWGREVRRRQRGLLLLTAHRAKGLEFDHVVVLDGDWARVGKDEDGDAPRRLYYVAMTRAMRTLTLMRLPGPHPFQDALPGVTATLFRDAPAALPAPAPELSRSYRRFSLGDVFHQFRRIPATLGIPFTALSQRSHPETFCRCGPGPSAGNYLTGTARWSGSWPAISNLRTGMRCECAAVMAIVRWDRERSEPQFQANLRSDSWEVVVPELVFQPDR